jgi:hypothetical protein
MAGRIILYGELEERYESERLLGELHPELHVESTARSWDLVERACTGDFDVAVILKGPIWEHQGRLEVITALRRNAFAGRVLHVGAFLTEKHEALAAGADFSFDPEHHPVEEVVARSLYRPLLAADHPYLRYLYVGEWARLGAFDQELPAPAPDVLVIATSCHGVEGFYHDLVKYTADNPHTHCILVEDGGNEDVQVAALSTGVQPYVVLAEEGLAKVAGIGRRLLRECWLAKVSVA